MEISDDMLLCLNALRWSKADLDTQVPNGEQRILDECRIWGFGWPENRMKTQQALHAPQAAMAARKKG